VGQLSGYGFGARPYDNNSFCKARFVPKGAVSGVQNMPKDRVSRGQRSEAVQRS